MDAQSGPSAFDSLSRQHQICFDSGCILLFSDSLDLIFTALQSDLNVHVATFPNALPMLLQHFPGRVTAFLDWGNLPWPDQAFDSVIIHNMLDHLRGGLVAAALASLKRIAQHGLTITTYAHTREFLEKQAFSLGFRKPLAIMHALPYETLEYEQYPRTIILESIPVTANNKFPFHRLLESRDLHMDMLRESGRRSDGYLVRYTETATLVPPGGVVLDAACGLGYGAAIISKLSKAKRVIGVDLDEWSIEYAAENFGCRDSRINYFCSDVTDLSLLPDDSVDLVASFETIEHIPDYFSFLREVNRVLKPGGRIAASVPNLWVDETGQDPNPYHLHIFNWERFRAAFDNSNWKIEHERIQTTGGGFKLHNAPRRIYDLPTNDPAQDIKTEWCLLTVSKI